VRGEKEKERGSSRDLNYVFIAGKGITRTRARGVAAEVNRNEISTGSPHRDRATSTPPAFPLPARSRLSNTWDPKCFSISRKIPRRAPPLLFLLSQEMRGGAEGVPVSPVACAPAIQRPFAPYPLKIAGGPESRRRRNTTASWNVSYARYRTRYQMAVNIHSDGGCNERNPHPPPPPPATPLPPAYVRERADNCGNRAGTKREARHLFSAYNASRIDGNSVAPARASNLRGNPPLIFPVAVSRSANNFIVTADAKRLKELPGPATGLLPSHRGTWIFLRDLHYPHFAWRTTQRDRCWDSRMPILPPRIPGANARTPSKKDARCCTIVAPFRRISSRECTERSQCSMLRRLLAFSLRYITLVFAIHYGLAVSIRAIRARRDKSINHEKERN